MRAWIVAVVLGAVDVAACRERTSQEPPAAAATAPIVPPCSGAPLAGSGDATYYEAADPGRCSFDPVRAGSSAPARDAGEVGEARLFAALNGPDYAHAAWC